MDRLKEEYPELWAELMEYIKGRQGVSYDFCRELLLKYNLNLEEERRLERVRHANQFIDEESNEEDDEAAGLNVTGNSDNLPGARQAKGAKTKHKKKEHMYQFVEWNFQRKSGKEKKDRLRKDHPSFPIVNKLLEKFKSGKEIKDSMAIKSAARYIYNIYMGKASDFA